MTERTNQEWCEALRSRQTDAAITDLRVVLLRGLRYGLISYGVTEADLEDFVQEALVKVLRELASFRGEARFTTWAQKVAVRVALTELRRRRWRDISLQDLLVNRENSDFTPDVLTDRGPDPEQTAVRRMMLEKIQRMIAEELTDRQRQAMMAVMQGGMPMQEVAERMGTNRNAMYKLLHDARQRLKKAMLREGLSPEELLAMFDER
ncbi:MAG: sigma-70 family RNA polymerase sigma factor [Chloroflexota bacterium]|nr:sigma-70 family RNA polymerase sigma factor [Chloroflexota bacterium]